MKRYIVVLVSIFSLVIQSCESFLEEKPRGFAAPELVFNSEAGITQALYGIYAAGTSNFWRERYFIQYSLTGDDTFVGDNNTVEHIMLDNYTFTSSASSFGLMWTGNTQGVSRANQLIEGIAGFEEGPFKKRIVAEAKFLRAMFYFMQVRTFGPAPLLTTYEGVELYPSNATIPAIYDQIIADLKEAEQELPGWKEAAKEKGRATRGAAKALLGKVYLTMATTEETADVAYFALAAGKLKEVMEEGYGLLPEYKEVFWPANEGGKEDVWSWQFLKGAVSGHQGYIHAQFSPNPDIFNQRGFGRLAIMPYLYEMFEEQDARKKTMMRGKYIANTYNESGAIIASKEYTTPRNYPYTNKFADPNWNRFRSNDTDTNWPLIRYADVLLMYSEAVNEAKGATPEAYTGIDAVRARAGASVLPRGLSQEQLRRKIRDERLLELHGEAHSWFDLVRWGTLEQRIKEVALSATNVSWPRHRFFPIPQTELDANPNLKQNPEY